MPFTNIIYQFERMNRSLLFVIIFFLMLTIGFTSYKLLSQPDEKGALIAQVLDTEIQNKHYNPIQLNDKLSEKVFELFLSRIDYNKKFFLKPDIQRLSEFKFLIDNEIQEGNLRFFELADSIFLVRQEQAKKYYPVILAAPFDFTQNESMESDRKKMEFAADTNALKESWRKYLKFQTLIRMADMIDSRDRASEKPDTVKKDTTYIGKTDAQLEEMARGKVLKNMNDGFNPQNTLDRNDRMNLFLGCIANAQDPHTEFFPPVDKQNFDIAMTGKLEGIGAQLQQRDGIIKVVSIVPGSPSYRNGHLKSGDIIMKVGQGSQEPVDISDMRLDKAIQLIRGKKGTEVRLTVKKPDGTIEVITLIRDVIIMEDTYAQSAIINDKDKIGYIRLPIFYADFNNNGGRDCAKDIKTELEKLKDEKVKGVILDLRDNGGGSLENVVTMVGLFIKQGPVVQVKSKYGEATLLNDDDPSVVYNGPLVILVNENSASASEIMAAAIQDYKRGVIIGGPTTFGKGTVQRIFDMDKMLNTQFSSFKPLGSVKITMQKFYRINGGSTQLRGVTPDIVIPDLYSYLKYGEKQEEYPMGWDEIAPAKYSVWTPSVNYKYVIENSKKRVEAQPGFGVIDNEAKEMKQEADNTMETLNLKDYRQRQQKLKEEKKSFDEMQKKTPEMNISNLPIDLQYIESDSTKISRNKEWLKGLKKDIYLNEAAKVVMDIK